MKVLSGLTVAVLLGILSLVNAEQKVSVEALVRQQTGCPINDICFAIDGSGSISDNQFELERKFVEDIATEIGSRTSEDTKYSAVLFSDTAKVIQTGTKDLAKFVDTVSNRRKREDGSTNMGPGLLACNDQLPSRSVNRVIVLVTDGLDNGSPPAKRVASNLKGDKVTIITVGVGSGTDRKFLREIATLPQYFLPVATFPKLKDMVLDVVVRSCAGQPSPSPAPPAPDACEMAFNKCDLRFKGNSKLQTFTVPNVGGRSFSKVVLSMKASGKLPKVSSLKARAAVIGADGKRTKIQNLAVNPPFIGDEIRATGTQRFRLEFPKRLKGEQRAALDGACVRVELEFSQGKKNRCAVFRLAA